MPKFKPPSINKIKYIDNVSFPSGKQKNYYNFWGDNIKKKNNNYNFISKNNIDNKPIVNSYNNTVAKSLGFKHVQEVDDFIRNINPHKLNVSDIKKLSKLYSHISKIAKNRKYRLAKLAVAGGSITAMIIFLQKYQKTHNGCFRYEKIYEEGEIKYKFDGKSWCNILGNNISNKEIKHIPESQHPLYNHKKWDCNYNKFPKGNKRIDNIINLGCNGLCDWKNFNILAQTTNGEYQPLIDYTEDKYIYRCETVNILQAFSSSTGEILSDTFSGIFKSDLGKDFINTLLRFIFIIVLIYMIVRFASYMRKKNLPSA